MATDHKTGTDRPGIEHPVERSTSSRQTRRSEWDRPSFSPFGVMRQGLDEMERWFRQFGMTPSSVGGMFSQRQPAGDWTPAIDAFQRGSEFVVRAEVPGMNRQDLTVEVGDDVLTIRGERKREFEEERDGVFVTERGYGSFMRAIPLPPGTIADSAKATFHNGILEVVVQAPSQETRRGRRVDISGQ